MKKYNNFLNENDSEDKHFNRNDINSILSFIKDNIDGEGEYTITDDDMDIDDYWGNQIPINSLLGYHIEMSSKGEHVHDGQMVEYTFIFTSPEGKKSTLVTNMCFVIGFNCDMGGFTIK